MARFKRIYRNRNYLVGTSYRPREEEPRGTTRKWQDDAPWRARAVVLVVLVMLVHPSIARAIVLPLALADLGSSVPGNVILFYDDYPTADPEFQITREIARPLVAHVNQDGTATDWMFDSLIFYSSTLYVAHHPTQSYIDSWINYIFDGGQIASLDGAVAEVKASLGQPDYRMNVVFAVPVVFNTTDTSGIFANIEKMLDRWNALNPVNLRLVAFYWGYTEDLEAGAEQTIPPVAAYLHSNNLKLVMVPYRTAAGYEKLHGLGVDYVATQPNYAQSSRDDLSVFATVNDRIVAGYSDGAELELPVETVECCGGDWRANLQTYLEQAYTYGWNRNTINVYFHGSDISFMGRDSGSDYRTAYEAIYGYIRSSRSITSRQVSLSARVDTSSSPPTVEISGSVYPAPGGPLNVTLEFSNDQGGTYQEMTRITSAADGTFTYSWKAPGFGVFMIRADVQGVKSSAVSIGIGSGVPGFPLESLAVGCVLGLLLVKHRRALGRMNKSYAHRRLLQTGA
jgi:hypothetical protein